MRFEKGNAHAHNGKQGRPPGSRNKLCRAVLEDLLADWAEGGAAAVKMMRVERPAEYVRVMCSILPKERREPIGVRKATLASILRQSRHGVRVNEHLAYDCGLTVFQHAARWAWKGLSRSVQDRAIDLAARRTG